MGKFYFNNLEIKNYRGIKNLKIEKLKRVNIIAGKNGSGKTTVIEAMFLLMNRRHGLAHFRHFMSKGVPIGDIDSINNLFYKSSADRLAEINATTRSEKISMRIGVGGPPAGAQISFGGVQPEAGRFPGISDGVAAHGLNVKTLINGVESDCSFSFFSGGQVNVNFYKSGSVSIPTGVIRRISENFSVIEEASKLSKIIKNNKIDNLISALKIIKKDIIEIKILYEANSPAIVVVDDSGHYLHVQFLGDGFVNLLVSLSSIICSEDGCVFLDEFDGTIHYLALKNIWTILIEAANKFNCQLFVATHSAEGVKSVYDASVDIGLSDDINYMRLDSKDGIIKTIVYSKDQLANSIEMGWEMR